MISISLSKKDMYRLLANLVIIILIAIMTTAEVAVMCGYMKNWHTGLMWAGSVLWGIAALILWFLTWMEDGDADPLQLACTGITIISIAGVCLPKASLLPEAALFLNMTGWLYFLYMMLRGSFNTWVKWNYTG